MKIKVKCIETGVESVFSTDDHHISLQLTADDLTYIKSLPETDDGRSPSGNEYRTCGFLRPVDDEEYESLSAWAKQ